MYTFIHVHAFVSEAFPREQVCATTKFWNICIFFHTYPDTHAFFPFSFLAFFCFAGVPREQIFVTTKLWTLQGDADYEGTLAALASASLFFSFSFFYSFFYEGTLAALASASLFSSFSFFSVLFVPARTLRVSKMPRFSSCQRKKKEKKRE